MFFPEYRPRRLRRGETLRKMVRETTLQVEDLVYPLFAVDGEQARREISSMPGIYRLSVELLVEEAARAHAAGIPAILLFGVPNHKNGEGEEAWNDAGTVQHAIAALKRELPELVVITDVCLCAYTDHGHCGVIRNGEVDNDATLERLSAMALSHARAGADIVAPSDMMDGRVGAIRKILDENDLQSTAIMSYAVKYASAYYGPFREAAESAPQYGDRRGYQMDPANRREALREAAMDVEEGADFLMVKPALAYLDVIRELRENFHLPLVAYNVSGEYSMVKASASKGWIDERMVVLETLTGMKRAGADLIITYHALEAASWIRSG